MCVYMCIYIYPYIQRERHINTFNAAWSVTYMPTALRKDLGNLRTGIGPRAVWMQSGWIIDCVRCQRCITEQLQLPNDKQRRGRTLSCSKPILSHSGHGVNTTICTTVGFCHAGDRLKVGHMSNVNQLIVRVPKSQLLPELWYTSAPCNTTKPFSTATFSAIFWDLYLLYAFCFVPATTCRWRRGSHHCFGPDWLDWRMWRSSEVRSVAAFCMPMILLVDW